MPHKYFEADLQKCKDEGSNVPIFKMVTSYNNLGVVCTGKILVRVHYWKGRIWLDASGLCWSPLLYLLGML